MRSAFRLALTLALVSTASAFAQGTITDGDAEFRRTGTPFDATPTADFVGVSSTLTQDHLFENGWWFRVSGDPQEFFFPVPNSQSYVGNESILTWNDVAGRGLFSAVETSGVLGFLGPSGLVEQQLEIMNLSGTTALAVSIYHMIDVDLAGAANDSAALAQNVPLRIIQITDPSANTAQYVASSPISFPRYLVRPFGATDVGAVLSDNAVDVFNDSGLPFGPGDFTAGWMFNLLIPPGGSDMVFVGLIVNQTAFCDGALLYGIFCDGVETGDTTFWSSAVP